MNANKEAVEVVARALSLTAEVRGRMRASVVGAWAVVEDPKGLCFLLKRGAVGGFVMKGQFPRGKVVFQNQGEMPWGLSTEVPDCFPASLR